MSSLIINILQITKHTQSLFTEMWLSNKYTEVLHKNNFARWQRTIDWPIASDNGREGSFGGFCRFFPPMSFTRDSSLPKIYGDAAHLWQKVVIHGKPYVILYWIPPAITCNWIPHQYECFLFSTTVSIQLEPSWQIAESNAATRLLSISLAFPEVWPQLY